MQPTFQYRGGKYWWKAYPARNMTQVLELASDWCVSHQEKYSLPLPITADIDETVIRYDDMVHATEHCSPDENLIWKSDTPCKLPIIRFLRNLQTQFHNPLHFVTARKSEKWIRDVTFKHLAHCGFHLPGPEEYLDNDDRLKTKITASGDPGVFDSLSMLPLSFSSRDFRDFKAKKRTQIADPVVLVNIGDQWSDMFDFPIEVDARLTEMESKTKDQQSFYSSLLSHAELKHGYMSPLRSYMVIGHFPDIAMLSVKLP